MTARDRITATLRDAFAPSELEVIDESHRHEGHAGHRPGGETHFRIRIAAAAFREVSRVVAHRMIYEALEKEIEGGVHALAIEARGG